MRSQFQGMDEWMYGLMYDVWKWMLKNHEWMGSAHCRNFRNFEAGLPAPVISALGLLVRQISLKPHSGPVGEGFWENTKQTQEA